jgi:hypothetical protein
MIKLPATTIKHKIMRIPAICFKCEDFLNLVPQEGQILSIWGGQLLILYGRMAPQFLQMSFVSFGLFSTIKIKP